MNRGIALSICATVAAVCALNAAEPMATAEITVDVDAVVGPVKPMHAVNNGPNVTKPGGDQKRGNFSEYRAARIPFARTHDANFSSSYGGPTPSTSTQSSPTSTRTRTTPKATTSSAPTIISTRFAAPAPRCSSGLGRR